MQDVLRAILDHPNGGCSLPALPHADLLLTMRCRSRYVFVPSAGPSVVLDERAEGLVTTVGLVRTKTLVFNFIECAAVMGIGQASDAD
jgi:hypothetical protein